MRAAMRRARRRLAQAQNVSDKCGEPFAATAIDPLPTHAVTVHCCRATCQRRACYVSGERLRFAAMLC